MQRRMNLKRKDEPQGETEPERQKEKQNRVLHQGQSTIQEGRNDQ